MDEDGVKVRLTRFQADLFLEEYEARSEELESRHQAFHHALTYGIWTSQTVVTRKVSTSVIGGALEVFIAIGLVPTEDEDQLMRVRAAHNAYRVLLQQLESYEPPELGRALKRLAVAPHPVADA
jgi:hypothetical protein